MASSSPSLPDSSTHPRVVLGSSVYKRYISECVEFTCGQSGHTPLVYTAACHAARRDPNWTIPDALYRGRAGCSSLLGVVELVVVLIVVLVLIVAIR